MQYTDPLWYTGEFDQQLEPDQQARRRPGKLPPATQRAVDDINRRYPGGLNDDVPEL